MNSLASWIAVRTSFMARTPLTRLHRTVSTSAKENQTFRLPDGRKLGFAEYGCQTGHPLLFFHGFPSSRLESRPIDHIARRQNLRIIAPDRPGFGLSSPQPGRRITDWPADVQALTQHLGISRFAILGGSGGGPYALACAHVLPHNMMSAVGLMASAAPWEAGTKHLLLSARIARWAVVNWPGGVVALMDFLVGMLRKGVNTRVAIKLIDGLLEKSNAEQEPGKDAVPALEQQRKDLIEIVFEGFAQGAEACVHEARLLTNNSWGFKFEDVTYNQIQLWHGTKDKNAPVQMMRYMAQRLPNCTLHEFENDNHFALGYQLENILSNLAAEQRMSISLEFASV